MKLYATTTTERASKGQGGNKRLEITVQGGEYRDILARFEVKNNEENAKKYGQIPYTVNIIDGDRLFLVHLKSKISFYLDQTEKGEKQKGETMKYFCTECGHIESWSAKLYSEKGEPVCPNDDNEMTLQ